ncbi:MAG: hypothetical protein H0T18_02520 [Chloroflexia bacterium]|nr:hypothetical protein [Chloroflexia bacterium]
MTRTVLDVSGEDRRGNRRELLTSSLKLVAAGAVVATGVFAPARVAAQDDNQGIGAGGRQGGDGGGGGGGRRRQRDQAAEGVGAGGRTMDVTAMPNTGVGLGDGSASSVAPLLLVAGAVGAATLAMKTRELATADSDVR